MFTLAIDESVDWVNVACAVAIAGCLPYTVWLSWREAREKREFAEKKAERSDVGSVEGTTVSSRA